MMIEDRWRSLGMNTAKKFKVGDLVSWKALGAKEGKDFGVIVEILEAMRGGRNVVLAKLVRFRDNVTVTTPIMSLKKVSENKTDEI